MKRKLIVCIILILTALFSINLCSCDIIEQDDTIASGTTDRKVEETTSVDSHNGECEETTSVDTHDNEIDEPGGEEDEEQQRFFSMDEFLLAINDIDAFCEAVDGNGSGGPVYRNFVKENLDEIIKYPFAYIDDFKSFKAEMTDGVLHATFVTENDVRYTFAYTPRSRLTPVYPNNTVDVLVIDGQSIEMGRRDHPGFGYYSLYGIWKNRDTYVNISISVDYDISSFEEQEEFYTVDLRELASQGFGEETICEETNDSKIEETT